VTVRSFPWSALPRVTAADAARTRDALRRLAPSPPRPDAALSARWRALLGGEVLAAPDLPAPCGLPDALPDGLVAVCARDDGALLLAHIDRAPARALAACALSLTDDPRPAPDAPLTGAEEGALMALCAKVCTLVCAPGPPLRVRAVTDDPADALHALRDATAPDATLLRWRWALHAAEVSATVTLFLPPATTRPWPFAPRPSVLGASVRVRVIAGRARWPVRELGALTRGDLLALDGISHHRGALTGGVDLSLGTGDAPSFSATLTPRGARIDAPATPPGAPRMTDALNDTAPAMDRATLDALTVDVSVEIAHAERTVGEVASWRPGAVLEFSTPLGEPCLVRAGGRTVARGELVDVDGRVGVRVTELL
jgi:flagellar motor switch/type III secretory pathway protein FliN